MLKIPTAAFTSAQHTLMTSSRFKLFATCVLCLASTGSLALTSIAPKADWGAECPQVEKLSPLLSLSKRRSFDIIRAMDDGTIQVKFRTDGEKKFHLEKIRKEDGFIVAPVIDNRNLANSNANAELIFTTRGACDAYPGFLPSSKSCFESVSEHEGTVSLHLTDYFPVDQWAQAVDSDALISAEINFPALPADRFFIVDSIPMRSQEPAVDRQNRIVVGLLDTSIYPSSELASRILSGGLDVTSRSQWAFGDNEHSHGTSMASLVATASSPSHVAILPVTMMRTRTDNPSKYDLASAFAHAVTSGARVVNASWVTHSCSAALRNEIIGASNVILVAASGNKSNIDLDQWPRNKVPPYPAAFGLGNVLVVMGAKSHGREHTSYGAQRVHAAGPIRWKYHLDGACTEGTGSSAGAAVVSGMLADYMRSVNHTTSTADIIDGFKQLVDPRSQLALLNKWKRIYLPARCGA